MFPTLANLSMINQDNESPSVLQQGVEESTHSSAASHYCRKKLFFRINGLRDLRDNVRCNFNNEHELTSPSLRGGPPCFRRRALHRNPARLKAPHFFNLSISLNKRLMKKDRVRLFILISGPKTPSN